MAARPTPRRPVPLPEVDANLLPPVFTVRAHEMEETNKIERDAWRIFLNWCHHVPGGTKVELLRAGKVCASLTARGSTLEDSGVVSLHGTARLA